jgi:hypothetical protein
MPDRPAFNTSAADCSQVQDAQDKAPDPQAEPLFKAMRACEARFKSYAEFDDEYAELIGFNDPDMFPATSGQAKEHEK